MRSSLPEVRNPVLQLSTFQKLYALGDEVKEVLAEVFMELRAEAKEKAERSWSKGKGPMAVYWKAVSVYAGHIARALRKNIRRKQER